MNGRHTVIILQHGARQIVRSIALRNNITVATSHTILTEHLYMISGFSFIWSVFDYMVFTLKRRDD